jgi:hypothetical protein
VELGEALPDSFHLVLRFPQDKISNRRNKPSATATENSCTPFLAITRS